MGKLNMDAMKSKLDKEAKASNYSNTEYDKLVDGKNVRRILWPKGDKEEFWSEGYLHFGLGEDGKSVATCPKTFNSKNRCPICEEVERLQNSKDNDDKQLAKDIKAKRRIYINVLNRDSDDEEDTPKVLPIGVTILKGLLEAICDPDYGDITDFDEGRDMTIKRTGKGLNTEYSVLPKPKDSVASETSTKEELEEKMVDLDSMFIEKSYEELEAILRGEPIDSSDDEEEEDDEEIDYDEMDIDELEDLCKKRKIKLPAKVTRLKLIALLNRFDEESEDEDDGDDDKEESEEDDTKDSSKSDDDDEESDELQDEIEKALANRKRKK